MKGLPVSLTQDEVTGAAVMGAINRSRMLFERKTKQTVPGLDAFGNGWITDIEKNGSEKGFAKLTKQYWPGGGGWDYYDVGKHNVRWSRTPFLILRRRDHDGLYVLMQGFAPDYWLSGWIWFERERAEIEWKKWWIDDPDYPYWGIPAAELPDWPVSE